MSSAAAKKRFRALRELGVEPILASTLAVKSFAELKQMGYKFFSQPESGRKPVKRVRSEEESPKGHITKVPKSILPSEDIQLCWECIGQLRKLTQFQRQVRKANNMIQTCQNFMFGTLSNLTTVIMNDTYPNIIYVNNTNIENDVDNENINHKDECDSVNNDNDAFNDDNDSFFKDNDSKVDIKVDNTVLNDTVNEKKEVNIDNQNEIKRKVKYRNKWAEKRARLNKKPKFKVLTYKELTVDKYFRREQIDVETSMKERDGDGFVKGMCGKCGITLKDEGMLLKHTCHKKTTGTYICDVCNRRLSQKSQLLRHIRRHFVKYYCKLCKFRCKIKEEGMKHLVNDHRKVFQCLKCELAFASRQEFSQHYKEWHEKFVCDHCGVSFKMRYCIKDHIRKQHSPFECAPCNKKFARYNGLWFHNKVCHPPPSDGPPLGAYCVECDKRFPDVYRYKWHLQNSVKHTPKKKIRVPCPDCSKVFSKNIYMKDHYNLVHLKNFKYRCEECDKNFVRNADLVKHRRKIHEGILPPKNKICYVCGRGFTTNEILSHHLRTHSGERPHQCTACPAAFAQRAALRAHKRTPHPSTRK
ncbi:zinc finger protein 250-like isoform X2 [Ostrinia furnacalis]|uniref:zinc finger protein 250-like isoform X2 n=1 Tax=Ostrinia furnacalis TaxID=93504 RepID=UPI001040313B|nr:zinc finger protein 250-like isoform X2 [Ostrinia furnacalis]